MKRSQWIRWGLGLCKTGLIVVLASLLTVYTTWSIVNVYLQDLLKPVAGLIGHRTNVEFVQLLTHMVAPGNTMKQAFPADTVTDDTGLGDSASDVADSGVSSDMDAINPGTAEAKEVSGQALEERILTMEDLLYLRDLWGADEVDVWIQRLMGQLKQSDMQRLAAMLENGLTQAELIEALQLLKPYMSMSGEE